VTGLFFALIYFTLVGIAGRGWGERYLLGLSITGVALFLAGVVHLPLVVAAVAAPLIGLALRKRAPVSEAVIGRFSVLGSQFSEVFSSRFAVFKRIGARDEDQPGYPVAATIVMTIPVVTVFCIAMIVPLNDFDGRVFWLKKAKAIAHERAIDGPFFRGEVMTSPRNHYPILVPLDAALVFAASGEADDRETRGMFVLTFAALLLVLRRGIARRFGAELGAWCTAIAAWLPPFLGADSGGALSGHADIPLAAFAACAFFELLEAESPLRLGVWLAAMTLTKNEGLPFALLLLVPAVMVFRQRVLVALAPLVTTVAALHVWRARIPATDGDNFLARVPLLAERLSGLGFAIVRVAWHMIAWPQWGVFWIAVAVCSVIALRRRMLFPLYVLFGMIAVYIAAYLVSSWQLMAIIDSSIDRLLMHLIAPALFVVAGALASGYGLRVTSREGASHPDNVPSQLATSNSQLHCDAPFLPRRLQAPRKEAVAESAIRVSM
jgi:hypothetical protein